MPAKNEPQTRPLPAATTASSGPSARRRAAAPPTLVKWPGGKTREWPEIAPHLPPNVRHFVDPFMGGLAPFHLTEFSGRAWLNDRFGRLVELHRLVQQGDAAFLAACDRLADAWDALAGVAAAVNDAFAADVAAERREEGTRPGRVAAPARVALDAAGLGDAAADVVASLEDKSRRLARLERKHETTFDAAKLTEQCETAVRAGFYYLVRTREHGASGPQAVADFLFLRDYCYGSMFRVNSKGEFNIPYGGASYNRKPFSSRVTRLRNATALATLSRATFHCGDFEAFLDGVAPQLDERDFLFLDPPYHSDFSTYGPNDFALDDHRRLAAAAARMPCPWLLVIKETPEVRAIYAAPGVGRVVHEFGKQYGYNVRGRNVRDVRHLVIASGPR